ncbi:uncharacterized protein LOC126708594 [Quercus robur]|uniref:uncharacterized protein LOC126708594 n=1 Tax=Quercus robur TaxID=38942 RepID=UPI00216219D6|nr:uncharacterized protein LOC126708594 [Quercus robur]
MVDLEIIQMEDLEIIQMEDLEKIQMEEVRASHLKQENELALNLHKNTMTGGWKEVVEMYNQHTLSAITARINTSGDTALHVAVFIAPEEVVQELVQVIIGLSLESCLWITNKDGNTPLHVAASTGRLKLCILIAHYDGFSGSARNNIGESPIFSAAFHGYKSVFLYLHFLLLEASDKDLESIDPAYRRTTDGETALHCAIRWEYFDLAFEILQVEPSLAYAVNELGITPLHLLASKPSVFKSGSHIGWWKKIIYYCIYVEELMHETIHQELIDSVIKKSSDDITRIFPENYKTCIQFYQVLQTMAELFLKKKKKKKTMVESVIERRKGQHGDVESANGPNASQLEQKESPRREVPSKHEFLRLHYAGWFSLFHLLYTIFIRVILGLGYEGIRRIKRKHVYSDQIMKLLVKSTKGKDFTSGKNPGQTIVTWDGQSSPIDSYSPQASEPIQQDGNDRNKIDLEQRMNGRGMEETSQMEKTETPLLILLPGKGKTPETAKIETPILVVARNGITEMVEQILQKFPIDINNMSKEKTETTILLAARNGIMEMVEHMLKEFPMAINDKSEGKNILLVAAKNRQTRVLQHLIEQEFVQRKLIHEVDMNENNALHLAAEIGKQKPWLIPGAALQMQWEIKWYEFVKDNMPQHFCYQVNKDSKTPEEIFNETHEELVKQGGEWLDKTSESCSVVAALIATVAFASSTTIPGNINEENGKPNLESHSMLTVFAGSSLIALCFSITALFSFLAILTSRYEQKDFRRDLPKKLLLGLTSLLVSITSMLISFCAGHYFMLKNKLKDKAFPVYAATCLPIVFFAIQQLPLYVDIVWAIFKNVPRSSYKAVSL